MASACWTGGTSRTSSEQAAKKAQDYLDMSSFSSQGLIKQLVFDGFTQAQAKYGVKAVGY